MEIRRFYPKTDLRMIHGWWVERGMPPIPEKYLPKVGFVVPGVAAGFLYQTDSKMGLIENYIANPASTKERRNEALDKITESLISEARKLGVQGLSAFTKTKPIIWRAQNHGFSAVASDYVHMVKEL